MIIFSSHQKRRWSPGACALATRDLVICSKDMQEIGQGLASFHVFFSMEKAHGKTRWITYPQVTIGPWLLPYITFNKYS